MSLTAASTQRNPIFTRPLHALACAALTVGLAATLKGFFSLDGFWEDEFFQIAFMNEGMPHFFIQVARLDQHPPFHFLQLKLWGTIFQSDKGLLLNSLVWHLISCGVIYWVGRWWLGTSAALLAVAFYVLSPQVVSASVGLRMYAMIPALAVGGWWLNYKLLTSSERRWWPWICLIGLQLALGYSHAIAIYFVAWIALAAAVQAMVDKTSSCWRRWFAVQAIAGVLLLPLMVSAIIRISMPGQSDVGGNNDPGTPLSHFGGMVSGWGLNSELGTTLGAALYAMALILGLWNKRTRTMTGAVLVGPYAFAAIIAYFVAPMFKTPVYSAMLMPFACLVLGGGLMALKGKAGPIIAVIVLTIMVASVFPASARLLDRVSPYKPLAVELARRVLPGDVVVVAKPYLYWAVMRYAVGPNWGSAFEVLPALNENWKKLVDKLGPDLASALKLKPKTDHVVHAGVTYVIGDDATRDSATAHRVWVVERIRYQIPVRLMHGFVDQGVMAEFGDREKTQLRLFVRQ